MPVVNPRVPEGLRDLMKGLTKEVLREKPTNIYEFSAQYFETLFHENKDFIVKEYEPAISYENLFQAKERNQIPVALVFKIIPEGLTELIKEFIKAVLRENPKNLYEFAVDYFRHIQKVGNIKNGVIQYTAYENYFNSNERFVFTPFVKCKCGRTFGEGLARGKEINKNQFSKKNTQNEKLKPPIDKSPAKITAVSVEKLENSSKGESDKTAEESRASDEPNVVTFLHSSESVTLTKIYDERYVAAIYVIQRFFKRCLKKQSLRDSKEKRSTQNEESSTQMSEEAAAIIIQRSMRKLFTVKFHKDDKSIPIVPQLENMQHLDEHNDNVSEAASYTSASTVQMSAESTGETTEREILEIGIVVSEEQAVIHTIEGDAEQQNDSAAESKEISDKITNSLEGKLNKHEFLDEIATPLIIGQIESQIVKSNKMESVDGNDVDQIENNALALKRNSSQLEQQLTQDNNIENLKIGIEEKNIEPSAKNTVSKDDNDEEVDEKITDNEDDKLKSQSVDENDDTLNSTTSNVEENMENILINVQDNERSNITDTSFIEKADDKDANEHTLKSDASKVSETHEKEATTAMSPTELKSFNSNENYSNVEANHFEEQTSSLNLKQNALHDADEMKLLLVKEKENDRREAKSDSVEISSVDMKKSEPEGIKNEFAENTHIVEKTESMDMKVSENEPEIIKRENSSSKSAENTQIAEKMESEESAAKLQNVAVVIDMMPKEDNDKLNSELKKQPKYADNTSIEALAIVVKERFFNDRIISSEEAQLEEFAVEEPYEVESKIVKETVIEKDNERADSKQYPETITDANEKAKTDHVNEEHPHEQNIEVLAVDSKVISRSDGNNNKKINSDTLIASDEKTKITDQTIQTLTQESNEVNENVAVKISPSESLEKNKTNEAKESEEVDTKEKFLNEDNNDDINAAVETTKTKDEVSLSSSNIAYEIVTKHLDQHMVNSSENAEEDNETTKDQKHISDDSLGEILGGNEVIKLEILEENANTRDINNSVYKNHDQSAESKEIESDARVLSSLLENHNLDDLVKRNGSHTEKNENRLLETEERKIVVAELLPTEKTDASQNLRNSDKLQDSNESISANESNNSKAAAEANEIESLDINNLVEKISTDSTPANVTKETQQSTTEEVFKAKDQNSNAPESAKEDAKNTKITDENQIDRNLNQVTLATNQVKTIQVQKIDDQNGASVDDTTDNSSENNKIDDSNALSTDRKIDISDIKQQSEDNTSRMRRDVSAIDINSEGKLLQDELANNERSVESPDVDNAESNNTGRTNSTELSGSTNGNAKLDSAINAIEIVNNEAPTRDTTIVVETIEVVTHPEYVGLSKVQTANNTESPSATFTEQHELPEEKVEKQKSIDSEIRPASTADSTILDKSIEIDDKVTDLKLTDHEKDVDERMMHKENIISFGQNTDLIEVDQTLSNIATQNADSEKHCSELNGSNAISTSEINDKENTKIDGIETFMTTMNSTDDVKEPTQLATKHENKGENVDVLQKEHDKDTFGAVKSKDRLGIATKSKDLDGSSDNLQTRNVNENQDLTEEYDTSTATPNSFDIGTQNSHEIKNENDINSTSSKQVKVGKSKIIDSSTNTFKNTKKSFITGQQHEPLFAEIHLKSFTRSNILDGTTLMETQQKHKQPAENNENKLGENVLAAAEIVDKITNAEIVATDAKILELNVVASNEVENQSEAAVKPQENERTATYLYGIHTPRNTPTLGRKNFQKAATAFTIPFDDNRPKKLTQTKQLHEQVVLEKSNDNTISNDIDKTENGPQGYETYTKLKELENEYNAESEIELKSPNKLFTELNIVEDMELDATITAEEAELLKNIDIPDESLNIKIKNSAENADKSARSTPDGILRTIVEINEIDLQQHVEHKIIPEEMINVLSETFDPSEFGSNSDNESDLTSSWTCSKETDENFFSDEFLNENTKDDDHYHRRRSSVIITGNDTLQGGIYEMDSSKSVLTNDDESKQIENSLDSTILSNVSMTKKYHKENSEPTRSGNSEVESLSAIKEIIPKSIVEKNFLTEIQSESDKNIIPLTINESSDVKSVSKGSQVANKQKLDENPEDLERLHSRGLFANNESSEEAKTLENTFTKNMAPQAFTQLHELRDDSIKSTQFEVQNTQPQAAAKEQQSALSSDNINNTNPQLQVDNKAQDEDQSIFKEQINKGHANGLETIKKSIENNYSKQKLESSQEAKSNTSLNIQLEEQPTTELTYEKSALTAKVMDGTLKKVIATPADAESVDKTSTDIKDNTKMKQLPSSTKLHADDINNNSSSYAGNENKDNKTENFIKDNGGHQLESAKAHNIEALKSELEKFPETDSETGSQLVKKLPIKANITETPENAVISDSIITSDENTSNLQEAPSSLDSTLIKNYIDSVDEALNDLKDDDGKLTQFWEQVNSNSNQQAAQFTNVTTDSIVLGETSHDDNANKLEIIRPKSCDLAKDDELIDIIGSTNISSDKIGYESKFNDIENIRNTAKVLDSNFTKNISTPSTHEASTLEEPVSPTKVDMAKSQVKSLEIPDLNVSKSKYDIKQNLKKSAKSLDISLAKENSAPIGAEFKNKTSTLEKPIEEINTPKIDKNYETPELSELKKALDATFTKDNPTLRSAESLHETFTLKTPVSPISNSPNCQSNKLTSKNGKSMDERSSSNNIIRSEVEKPQDVDTNVVEEQIRTPKIAKNFETQELTELKKALDATFTKDNSTLTGVELTHDVTILEKSVAPTKNSPIKQSTNLTSTNFASVDEGSGTDTSKLEVEKPQGVDNQVAEDPIKDPRIVKTPNLITVENKEIFKKTVKPLDATYTKNLTTPESTNILDKTVTELQANTLNLQETVSSSTNSAIEQPTKDEVNNNSRRYVSDTISEVPKGHNLLTQNVGPENLVNKQMPTDEIKNYKEKSDAQNSMDSLNILLTNVNENLEKTAKSFDETFVVSKQEDLEFVEKTITDLKADAIKLTELEALIAQAPSPPTSELSDDPSEEIEYRDAADMVKLQETKAESATSSTNSQDETTNLDEPVTSTTKSTMNQLKKLPPGEKDNTSRYEAKGVQRNSTVDSIIKDEQEIIFDKAKAAFIIQKAYRKYKKIHFKNSKGNQTNMAPKEIIREDANKLANAAQIIQRAYKNYKANKMRNVTQTDIPYECGSTAENSLDESQITVIFNDKELNAAKSGAGLSITTSPLSDNQMENHGNDHFTKKRSVEYMAPTAPAIEDHSESHDEESNKVNWFVGEEPIVRSAPGVNIADALVTDNLLVVVEKSHNLLTTTTTDACNNNNELNPTVEPAKTSSVTFVQAKLVDSTSSLFEPVKQPLSNISTLKSSDEIVSAAAEHSKSVPQESVSNSLTEQEAQIVKLEAVNGECQADIGIAMDASEDIEISCENEAGKFVEDIEECKKVTGEKKTIDHARDLVEVDIPEQKKNSSIDNLVAEKAIKVQVATDSINDNEKTTELYKNVDEESKQELEQSQNELKNLKAIESFENATETKHEQRVKNLTGSNKSTVEQTADFLETEQVNSNIEEDQTVGSKNPTAIMQIQSTHSLEDINYLTQFINLERKYWESDIPYTKLEETCTKKTIHLVEPVEDEAAQRAENSLSEVAPLADLDLETEQSSTDSLELMTKKLHEADVIIERMQLRRASTARSNSNDDGKNTHELSFDEPVIKSMQELQENRSSELEDEEAAVILNRLQREDTRESSAQSDAVVFGENNSPENNSQYELKDSPMMKLSLQRVHTIAGDNPKSLFKSVTIDDTVQYIEPPECDTTATSGSSFCLDDDVSENIRKKMMAYSLSEADSDFFDYDTGDATARMGKPKLHMDDFNISTALVDLAGTSTDTESTIVSAATRIQAGARGFLTRKRLRRASGGTKSTLPDNSKASFGNAAISESLERLIEEEAAKKIQHAYRKHYRQKDLPTSVVGEKFADKRQVTNTDDEEDAHVLLGFESTLAARRLTLQRGDALRNDSTPDEDNGNGNVKLVGSISNKSDKVLKQESRNDLKQSVDKSNDTEGSSLENNSMHTHPGSKEIGGSESFEDEKLIEPALDISVADEKTEDSSDKSSTNALTADANTKKIIDNELKWISLRQNSMPVQIEESEVFRVIPKHMRKRNKSAESQMKKRLRVLKD